MIINKGQVWVSPERILIPKIQAGYHVDFLEAGV